MNKGLVAIGAAGCCVVLGSYMVANYRNNKKDETNSYLLQNSTIVSENVYNENSESIDLKNNIDDYLIIYDEDGIGNKRFHIVREFAGREITDIGKYPIEFNYNLGTGKEILKRYNFHAVGLTGVNELYMDLLTGNIINVTDGDYVPYKETGNKILKKASAYPIAVQYFGDKERYTKEDLEVLMSIINDEEKVEEKQDNKVLVK